MQPQDLLMYLLYFLAAILAVVFTGAAVTIATAMSMKAWRVFAQVDQMLIPFGQSATGRYVNHEISQLAKQADPLATYLSKATIFKEAYEQGWFKEEDVRRFGKRMIEDVFGLGAELTDGNPMDHPAGDNPR